MQDAVRSVVVVNPVDNTDWLKTTAIIFAAAGHFGYFFFYVFCGMASGLTHIAFNLHNGVPAVGASGAISGVP